jgi:hypothetical protein
MTMKWHPNMTEEQLREFMAEVNALDAAYAAAAQDDEKLPPLPEEWEDEMETLRRAALSGGRP